MVLLKGHDLILQHATFKQIFSKYFQKILLLTKFKITYFRSSVVFKTKRELKWTIFEISFLWKHQSLCFHYWDYLTNFWHNNWRSIIDVVERFSYLMNELWNEYFLSKNMKNELAGKTCVWGCAWILAQTHMCVQCACGRKLKCAGVCACDLRIRPNSQFD